MPNENNTKNLCELRRTQKKQKAKWNEWVRAYVEEEIKKEGLIAFLSSSNNIGE